MADGTSCYSMPKRRFGHGESGASEASYQLERSGEGSKKSPCKSTLSRPAYFMRGDYVWLGRVPTSTPKVGRNLARVPSVYPPRSSLHRSSRGGSYRKGRGF